MPEHGSEPASTPVFDPALPYRRSPQVALRPEPFGALAYHFGTRRLSFLKTPVLVTVVESLAGRLAAGPPVALSLTKSLLHRAATTDFAASLELEAMAQAVNFANEDIGIGLRAFKARTAPTFTGRWRTD